MSEKAVARSAPGPKPSGGKAVPRKGTEAPSARGTGRNAKSAGTPEKRRAVRSAEGKPKATEPGGESGKRKAVPSAEGKGKVTRSAETPGKRKPVRSAEGKEKETRSAATTGKHRTVQSAGGKAKAEKPDAEPGKRRTVRSSGGKAKAATAPTGKDRGVAGKAASGKRAEKRNPRKRTTAQKNPEGEAANRKNTAADLFMERADEPKLSATDGMPPRGRRALFGALNACLAIAIAVLLTLGLRLHGQYGEFLRMREVVDKQTFYEGTTVEGVDVSRMTLANAMDYWRNRVEARNAERTVTLDDGTAITAAELGYTSDYESVLTTAWSHGRSGTLEERYRMAASRLRNPAAYAIHRTEYSDALVDQFVQMQALKIDQEPADATVAEFNVDTYEFTFNPSRNGRQLDTVALKRDLLAAMAAGGGNVNLSVTEQAPEITTDRIGGMYGLIDYAITNANSSSKARLNNIKLAMSMINGTKLAPGETFSFNDTVGQRTSSRGFRMATAYSGGEVTEQVGGGICQVSTTLFNAAVKADMQIDERHNHSLTVHYVDKGKDATVDWGNQDLKFTNTSPDDIYICCYLTEDRRVRFGIFGRLLPNGEKITLDAVTVRVNKFETQYQPDPSLGHGQTRIAEEGRDGYKAEAYKVRWDAEGNELSRELLCTSVYKSKDEIVLYGA